MPVADLGESAGQSFPFAIPWRTYLLLAEPFICVTILLTPPIDEQD